MPLDIGGFQITAGMEDNLPNTNYLQARLDALTATTTISGVNSNIGSSPLSGITYAVIESVGSFTSSSRGILFENGGGGRGVVVYIYNNTIYAQGGDGSVAGGSVEVSYNFGSATVTRVVVYLNTLGNPSYLWVNDVFVDTAAGSDASLSGSNNAGAGDASTGVAVRRDTQVALINSTLTVTRLYASQELAPHTI